MRPLPPNEKVIKKKKGILLIAGDYNAAARQ